MTDCSRTRFPTRAFFKKALSALTIPAIGVSLMFFLPISRAEAAPQILAVAATDIEVPMRCERGECAAELTTICLQEHRGSPDKGTAYYLPAGNRLDISMVTETGEKIALPNLKLDIRAARGHNMVRVTFPEKTIRALGPLRLEVSVPAHVTLVPVPAPDDRNPQTPADIALTTGPLRLLADRMVDQDGEKRKAAELVTQVINRLPFQGHASKEERATSLASFAALKENAAFSTPAKTEADAVIQRCDKQTIAGNTTFKECLGSWHDHLIGKLNTQYWKAVETGS
ncbi:MAG: hypothetical protein EP348_00340 [Alphaproteobacteria bacterium]|nr:MAG: hypothetical protein EP348_00340 [Alphaproteobacteria bacterium]